MLNRNNAKLEKSSQSFLSTGSSNIFNGLGGGCSAATFFNSTSMFYQYINV